MTFVVFVILFGIFFLGLVVALQGFIGHEIRSEGAAFGMPIDIERPGMSYPPERHRWRLVFVGLALMTCAFTLAVVVS